MNFKPFVPSYQGNSPFDGFDSRLEKPSGADINQNAWLTVELKLKLNFVDSTNPPADPARLVNYRGRHFAKDLDGFFFPVLRWPQFLKDRFAKEMQMQAEKTWNYQFLLITPRDYSGLDVISNADKGYRVRPNVLCLFRLKIVNSGEHKLIDIFNLDLTTQVTSNGQRIKWNASNMNSYTFRSDSETYDDRDVFNWAVYDEDEGVYNNTLGHELGHALGQSHIMGLKGDASCRIESNAGNADKCYGKDSADKQDRFNIMGMGDRVQLVNAVTWRERMAVHTGRRASDWVATGMVRTPPRKTGIVVCDEATLQPF